MIQKSPEEKMLLKQAKAAYKKELVKEQIFKKEMFGSIKPERKKVIMTGIVEGEEILENSYPVYWDYFYVIDDNGGKVVRSDIKGTILDLKKDLRSLGFKALNIYNCNIAGRCTN